MCMQFFSRLAFLIPRNCAGRVRSGASAGRRCDGGVHARRQETAIFKLFVIVCCPTLKQRLRRRRRRRCRPCRRALLTLTENQFHGGQIFFLSVLIDSLPIGHFVGD